MAEGLQRRIEYSDLKFISSFAMEKILDFQTWEEPGEHARGNFRLLLSENETGINGMNAPIQLLEQGNTAGALFSGYPEKVEIKEERGYRIADIQAVSGTILLDQKKSNRVFQKKVQTYMGIAGIVTADTEHSACILPGSDMRTGGTLIQYQETDWRFLKRMASQLGLPLVPDTSYYYPRFYLGLPEGEKRELGEIISCDLCFDGRYYAVSGKCLVDREDFICYDVVTRTSLSLGDRVTYEGRELLVSRKKTELAEGVSSLCVNGSVDMLGRLAGISASKYTGYPPYDDAPKEGEFDWDGFTRNLAIGLGVVAVCAIGAAISIATLGAGSILAGAFIGAGIGALSTTAMKEGEEISTGNVRSAGERLAYAVFDDSMSWDEKWAYAFDPGQMVADFVTGVVIGEILDGIMAATQNKLRSIFANYDAAMREALESGLDANLLDDMVEFTEEAQ